MDELHDAYFARLLRGFRSSAAAVDVVPYSFTLASEAQASLQALLDRAMGGHAKLAIATPVAYGEEDEVRVPGGEVVVAVFNATSTPEPEAHGRFLARLAQSGRPVRRDGRRSGACRARRRRRDAHGVAARVVARDGVAVRPRRSPLSISHIRTSRPSKRIFADLSMITLSLVSHTNAGKTTLARTLLGRDVGEVRDAPHVTTEASAYPLIETAQGDALVLWDTPGFGDSARLAKRLALEGNPIGWFLTQVWDRFRDRAFFLTQRAVRNVRDEADVVLYLVSAAEDPADAGYLAPELGILAWTRKPVLVLLNQTGPSRRRDEDVARWRRALVPYGQVRGVVAFDAFARCWVQELVLFDADRRRAARREEGRVRPAGRGMAVAAACAIRGVDGRARAARSPLPHARASWCRAPRCCARSALRSGWATIPAKATQASAAQALASDASARMREAMDALIAAHGLDGRAAADVETLLANDIAREGPVDEGKAAAMGGVLSGAMTGLAADLAAGGLTFGAGMLTGAVLGALGGAGIARAFNVARGQTDETIRFDDAFVERLVSERDAALSRGGALRPRSRDLRRERSAGNVARRHRRGDGRAPDRARRHARDAHAGLRCGGARHVDDRLPERPDAGRPRGAVPGRARAGSAWVA